MGNIPSEKHQIDRIDNNLCYSKDNCKWASRSDQMANRRQPKNSKAPYRGVTITPEGKYKVRLRYQNKNYHIGHYVTLSDAIIARKEAELKFFGRIISEVI